MAPGMPAPAVKVASLTSWDMELLPIELADLKGVDFDLGLLGFSAEDLAAIDRRFPPPRAKTAS